MSGCGAGAEFERSARLLSCAEPIIQRQNVFGLLQMRLGGHLFRERCDAAPRCLLWAVKSRPVAKIRMQRLDGSDVRSFRRDESQRPHHTKCEKEFSVFAAIGRCAQGRRKILSAPSEGGEPGRRITIVAER